MGEVKTGALIVIEQKNRLDEYIRTGINVDAVLSSQLLINIFEHNTPLHDGAVVMSCLLYTSQSILDLAWDQPLL